jgi:hypothetical protein
MSLSKLLGFNAPKPPPPPPTVDEAADRIQKTDRMRKRLGQRANIFAGAPGKQTLGG